MVLLLLIDHRFMFLESFLKLISITIIKVFRFTAIKNINVEHNDPFNNDHSEALAKDGSLV